MKHPLLAKKLNDVEYERRLNRFCLTHLLMLIPLVCYVAISYLEFGRVSPPGMVVACCGYVVVLALISSIGRRHTLDTMRREGLIDGEYQPPLF